MNTLISAHNCTTNFYFVLLDSNFYGILLFETYLHTYVHMCDITLISCSYSVIVVKVEEIL